MSVSNRRILTHNFFTQVYSVPVLCMSKKQTYDTFFGKSSAFKGQCIVDET